MEKVKDKNLTRNKHLTHQNKINFVTQELNNRADALDVICTMLEFKKRYMLPVSIHFPSMEKTLNVDNVLENWKADNPKEFNKIELLWRESEFGADMHGNSKKCPNSFVVNNIGRSY